MKHGKATLLPLIDGSPKLKKAPVGSPGRCFGPHDAQRGSVGGVNAVGSTAEIRRLSPECDGVTADGWFAETVELLARVT